jgi:hypothetical protein
LLFPFLDPTIPHNNIYYFVVQNNGYENKNGQNHLKSDLSADHAAEAGTPGPAAADLALEVQVAVFIADGDAAAAAVALVVGIQRARKPGRRGAGVGVGKVNGLHWISREVWGGQRGL